MHGFCLMPNHYDLLVETPRANLSRAMGWLHMGRVAIWIGAWGRSVCGSGASMDREEERPRQGPVGEIVKRMENTEARQATVKTLGQRQEERSWQVWVRIILGGERRIDVARDLGYKDGSAITQILKRLESVSQTDPATRSRMAALRTENEKQMSSIESWCAREAGVNAGESPAGAIRRFSTEDRANCVAARRGGEQAWSRTCRS